METSTFIAKIMGLCYLVLGVGLLINRNLLERVMKDFCKNAALLFIMGIFTLVIGIVIILKHNIWVAHWPVIITIIGWVAFIKGIWLTIFPDSVIKITQSYAKNKNMQIIHPVAVIVFGAFMTYFGFFAK